MNILVRRSRSSGDLETACPELGTALDNLLLTKQFVETIYFTH